MDSPEAKKQLPGILIKSELLLLVCNYSLPLDLLYNLQQKRSKQLLLVLGPSGQHRLDRRILFVLFRDIEWLDRTHCNADGRGNSSFTLPSDLQAYVRQSE